MSVAKLDWNDPPPNCAANMGMSVSLRVAITASFDGCRRTERPVRFRRTITSGSNRYHGVVAPYGRRWSAAVPRAGVGASLSTLEGPDLSCDDVVQSQYGPAFFMSQSSSIFNWPISACGCFCLRSRWRSSRTLVEGLANTSGSRVATSFFHWPT